MEDDPAKMDTPLADETDAMAEVTRLHADKEDPDQRTPEGSHDSGAGAAAGDGKQHLGQEGVGQSDDISGQAPASGMAQQHANPSEQRDRDEDSSEQP